MELYCRRGVLVKRNVGFVCRKRLNYRYYNVAHSALGKHGKLYSIFLLQTVEVGRLYGKQTCLALFAAVYVVLADNKLVFAVENFVQLEIAVAVGICDCVSYICAFSVAKTLVICFVFCVGYLRLTLHIHDFHFDSVTCCAGFVGYGKTKHHDSKPTVGATDIESESIAVHSNRSECSACRKSVLRNSSLFALLSRIGLVTVEPYAYQFCAAQLPFSYGFGTQLFCGNSFVGVLLHRHAVFCRGICNRFVAQSYAKSVFAVRVGEFERNCSVRKSCQVRFAYRNRCFRQGIDGRFYFVAVHIQLCFVFLAVQICRNYKLVFGIGKIGFLQIVHLAFRGNFGCGRFANVNFQQFDSVHRNNVLARR